MATPSIRELKEQHEKLKKVIEVATEYGTPDRASQFGMNALRQEEAHLIGAIKLAQMAEAKTAVEVAVDGDPVRDHAISIAFLGPLLVCVQGLTNAIAQVKANAQTARGNFKNDLIARNRFELATVFESSFGIGLRLPEEEQGELFKNEDNSPADIVCNLLNGTEMREDAMDFLASPRVRSHYAALVDLIGKQGASIVFRTRKYPIGSKLTAQQARDRTTWLDLLKIESETIPVDGALVGGSIESKKFEIKTDAGDIIRGNVTEAAIIQMKDMNWGAFISAQIEIAVSSHEEAELEPRTAYRLINIKRREVSVEASVSNLP